MRERGIEWERKGVCVHVREGEIKKGIKKSEQKQQPEPECPFANSVAVALDAVRCVFVYNAKS